MTRTLESARTDSGRLALVAISAGFALVILDTTIVAVALDRMAVGLHTTVTGLEWVVDGYTVTVAALLMLGGGLADRFGARRSFQVGLAFFGLASVACAAAPAVGVLVAARIAQGIGAALLIPASLALIRYTYPDEADRARATGVWGAIGSTAASCGPVLGGVLSENFGWPAIFAINAPICAVTAVVLHRTAPSAPGVSQPIPLLGHLSAVIAMAGVTAAAILAGARPVRSGVLAVAVVAAIAGVLLGSYAARTGKGLLPSGLRGSRTFTTGTLIGLAQNFGFYGQLFVISLFLQRNLHYSPTATGFALLPEAAIGIVASALGGRHAARYGSRRVIVTGLSVGAAGLLGLACIGPHTPFVVLAIPLLLTGFGMAYTMPAATHATVSAAGPENGGLAGAAFNAARQLGSALGVAVVGSLMILTPGAIALPLSVSALVFVAAALLARQALER
ncbi:MFS transporter [Nocardia sp. CDC160]|uniref:MFS transporter n=1 Tax=Nocardia sp. CDC160 TaxID=3112166 RepID=UPI002DB96F24|nr:MFS transporter [Nocardia sp. CDC160]MEC3920587.1 MFS transporter [Nocardia sp. CDC160]